MKLPIEIPRATNGKPHTRQLFWEEWIELPNDLKIGEPIFSLYKDKPGLINLQKEYVAREDPTGYRVAMEVFGDYNYWKVLNNAKWFQAARKVWDEELDAKMASKAIKELQELSRDGPPPQRLAASKYLANQEHRKDTKSTKGRPSKAQIDEKAAEEAAFERQINEDLKRIRLVKG